MNAPSARRADLAVRFAEFLVGDPTHAEQPPVPFGPPVVRGRAGLRIENGFVHQPARRGHRAVSVPVAAVGGFLTCYDRPWWSRARRAHTWLLDAEGHAVAPVDFDDVTETQATEHGLGRRAFAPVLPSQVIAVMLPHPASTPEALADLARR